ncbi:MAG: hypothetical protein ACFB51_01765 [Anaerolineae bacterium]
MKLKEPLTLEGLLPLIVWVLIVAGLTAANSATLFSEFRVPELIISAILIVAVVTALTAMGQSYSIFLIGILLITLLAGGGVRIVVSDEERLITSLWPFWCVVCLVYFPVREGIANFFGEQRREQK